MKASACYSIPVYTASATPADSTTYYFGASGAGAATTGTSPVYPLKAGCIRGVSILMAGTAGTSEATAFSIVVSSPASTTTINAAVDCSVVPQQIRLSNVAIPVDEGANIQIKFIAPAWVTNPIISFKGYLLMS